MRTTRFTNCVVYTPWDTADSVVFSDRIIQVGGGLRADVEVDLGGAVVAPGFVDSHAHLRSTAFKLATVDLQGKTRLQVVRYLSDAQPNMGGWVYARGWDESFWDKPEYLAPDEIENSAPVLAVRVDGHMGVVNTEGIRVARSLGLNVGVDGVVREGELTKLVGEITRWYSYDEWLTRAQDHCLEEGVTTVCDIDQAHTVDHYIERPPKVRVVLCPIGLSNFKWRTGEEVGPNLYWGFTKLFADGSIGARTAAVSSGYVDGSGDPRLLYTDSQLEAVYTESLSRGMEPMTHAIGDLAVAQVIRVSGRFAGRRLRVEHNELVLPEELEANEASVVCSMQPNFLQWSYPGGLYERRLGPAAVHSNNHYACLLRLGVRVAFGSDSMPLGPANGINLALNPPSPKQKLSLRGALTCYTYNSAYANHLEHLVGSIEPGKAADLVVLDTEPRVKVKQTYFGGIKVYG
jgi:predicted amidohydrolase YtcJ